MTPSEDHNCVTCHAAFAPPITKSRLKTPVKTPIANIGEHARLQVSAAAVYMRLQRSKCLKHGNLILVMSVLLW